MERIEADLLIPGSEGPVREGVVLVDSGQISYAGPAATIAMGTDILVSTPGAPASWGTSPVAAPR